jgi:phosphopantetheinyl transferase
VFEDAAAVMQAVESQTLILYHTDLRGQWPQAAASALARSLRYAKRLEVAARGERAAATLAGIALALHALSDLHGRTVGAAELTFPDGGKPRLADEGMAAGEGADFSIAHSGHWVGCAAVARGLVGFDVELGGEARLGDWAAREAALKACGLGITAAREVELGDGRAVCRGVSLHPRPLALFAGAAACVMISEPVTRLTARALALEELFAA